MDTFGADVRYALRMLRGNFGVTAVALAALALGIGANTAIFSVVNAVLLQPLPYSEPDRIMQVDRQFGADIGYSNSIPKYMVWRQNQVFEAMTLYVQSAVGMNLGSGDRPEQVKTLQASDGFFKVFGVRPLLGRTYTPEEDIPNGPPVAVMSYGLWQSRFAADPGIVGRAITLNGAPFTVLGVLPKEFQSDPPAEVWLPLQADPNSTNQGHYLTVAGRLKQGVSVAQARAAMKVVGERFRALHPKWMNNNESVAVVPMQEAVVGPVRTPLLVLLGAVAFVLLIACANVANLLLARAAMRQREMAVRSAMGASRWRVVRQLLTESVILSGLGGILGFILGSWGVRGLLLLAPGNIPRLTDPDGIHAALPSVDWRVAAFTIGVAALTGILFGIFPALQSANPDLASTLKETGGRSGVSRRQHRARSVLVVSEVALALVLLIGATLLIRTFVALRSVNPGFDPRNVLTMRTSIASASYSTTARVDNLITQVTRRVESLPGVESAAVTVMLPVRGGIDLPFNIVGRAPGAGQTYNGDEQWRSVSPHYFQVFKIGLLRGRPLRETDTGNSAPVVVINEAMARRYWPKEDPIGQVIVIGKGIGPQLDDPPRQIVGVVANARESGLSRGDLPVMYLPQSQVPDGVTALIGSMEPLAWAVRIAGDPEGLRVAITREIHAVDGLLPVSEQRMMADLLSESMAREKFNMALLGVFAGIALLLAAIGIYGLMSYSVEQRTQEIGIRMALGGNPRDILRLMLREAVILVGAGTVLGIALAYGVTRLLASMLFGVQANDPLTFTLVAGILALVALVATLVPARRAAAVEPSEALRYT